MERKDPLARKNGKMDEEEIPSPRHRSYPARHPDRHRNRYTRTTRHLDNMACGPRPLYPHDHPSRTSVFSKPSVRIPSPCSMEHRRKQDSMPQRPHSYYYLDDTKIPWKYMTAADVPVKEEDVSKYTIYNPEHPRTPIPKDKWALQAVHPHIYQ